MDDVTKKDYTEPKKFDKQIEGEAIVKEKGLFKRIGETFLSEDAQNVKDYIFRDVIIPAIKDTIVSIVQNGVEMLFYGETKASSIARKSNQGTYIGYSSMFKGDPRDRKVMRSEPAQTRSDGREFIYPTRGQADEALHLLYECLEDYRVATVADLCRISRIAEQYTDNYYGWYDLSGAHVKRIFGNQFVLVLPKPMYIE